MKVSKDMIDKQLYLRGKILSKLTTFNQVITPERTQNLITRIFKGKTSSKMVCSEIYLSKKDDSPLRVCIYQPCEQQPNAVGLLWLHGGGYAMGVPEQDIPFFEKFMATANCVIVAPDYEVSVKNP